MRVGCRNHRRVKGSPQTACIPDGILPAPAPAPAPVPGRSSQCLAQATRQRSNGGLVPALTPSAVHPKPGVQTVTRRLAWPHPTARTHAPSAQVGPGRSSQRAARGGRSLPRGRRIVHFPIAGGISQSIYCSSQPSGQPIAMRSRAPRRCRGGSIARTEGSGLRRAVRGQRGGSPWAHAYRDTEIGAVAQASQTRDRHRSGAPSGQWDAAGRVAAGGGTAAERSRSW